jgi:hypothetical protein
VPMIVDGHYLVPTLDALSPLAPSCLGGRRRRVTVEWIFGQ